MRGEMTYFEIAKALGISKARVQQLEQKALQKVSEAMKAKGYKPAEVAAYIAEKGAG